MGTGKSNLLNAINWCLYKKEPFLSRENKEKFPQLNSKRIEDAGEKPYRMMVEINAEAFNGQMSFKREQFIKVIKKPGVLNNTCQIERDAFYVTILDDKGNSKIYTNEEAKEKVRLFVPDGIKDFFFFDGEKLDKYFKEATGQNIKNAIYQISQVHLIDKIRDHMEKVLSDLHKEAGKLNPEIEETRRELERITGELETANTKLETCKSQIKIATEHIDEIEEHLRGVPEVGELQKQKDALVEDNKGQEKRYLRKVRTKQEMLFTSGIDINLFPVVSKVISMVEEKREKKEIPPRIDPDVLKDIIQRKICICKRGIDSSSEEEKAIINLLNTITLSPEITREIEKMESSLKSKKLVLKSYTSRMNEITSDITAIDGIISKNKEEIEKIDKQIEGFDMEQISDWTSQLREYGTARDKSLKLQGVIETQVRNLEKLQDGLQKKLDTEVKKETKVADIKNDIFFAENIIKVLKKASGRIIDLMREKIQEQTEKKFLDLHWKSQTFGNVFINKDYSIVPVHKATGFNCLSGLSGGETEILALAFSFALHNISGYESTIAVDRPFTNVSGITKQYISEVFVKIGDERQVILFLTPDDYTSDIKAVLENEASNIFTMKLSPDEKELVLEG